MLSHLRVKNFRCLRDTSLSFTPLTVLIGKNDSGKTSILDAIRLLGQSMSRPIAEVFSGVNHPRVLSWCRQQDEIRWEATITQKNERRFYGFGLYPMLGFIEAFGENPSNVNQYYVPEEHREDWSQVGYSLNPELWVGDEEELIDEEELTERREELQLFLGALQDLERFRFSADALRTTCRPTAGAVLSGSGETLTSVLDLIFTGVDSSRRCALERDLHKAIPTLRGLGLRTLESGKKTIEYILSHSSAESITVPCENASDGALLVTAYLALAYSETPGMLLIEEPENGLHPSLLHLIFNVLRKVSVGDIGTRPRQVVITTQSPLLLNYASKEEVQVVRRSPEHETVVSPLKNVPDIDRLLEEFSIGELWYNLGEDALWGSGDKG